MKKNNLHHFFLPSISSIFFIAVFLYISLFGGQSILSDSATGSHIRAGDFIVKTLTVPRYDFFSFIYPSLPWIAHEWFSEVIMSLIHSHFGLTGIVLFFAFVIAFTFTFFFRIIKSYRKNMLISVLLLAVVIATSSIHWLARPHIFSLFLIVVWYYLLDLYQYENRNYLYFLPFIMIIWVNMHGGFIIALLLTAIYFTGNMIKMIFSEKEDKALWRNRAKFFAVM
jgi:hypothetical protein